MKIQSKKSKENHTNPAAYEQSAQKDSNGFSLSQPNSNLLAASPVSSNGHGSVTQAKFIPNQVHQLKEEVTSPFQLKENIIQTKKKDPVEEAVLKGYNKKKQKKQLKKSLADCMDKFKSAIEEGLQNLDKAEYDGLQDELDYDGRDAFFYRKIWWKNKLGIYGDVKRWKKGWSVARTGGLLADLGLTLRDVPKFSSGFGFDDIMNKEYLQKGSDHVRGREGEDGQVPQRSDWSDDIAQSGIKGNAGPSSTTTQLLRVVSGMGVFSNEEVEAMMVALVKFWKGGLKQKFGGGHHTAAEVWAPYTGYLEAQNEDSE